MTNGKQTWIAERIDRRREHDQAKTDRTARQRGLDARALAIVTRELAETPEVDRIDYAEALHVALRVQHVALQGPTPAASFLGKQSYEAARGILPGKVAHAAAEQAFAKLTRPSNDNRGQE